jgi:hypothetical protein
MNYATPEFYAMKAQMASDSALRNRIGNCPMCGANIKDRTVTIFRELIDALYEVYKWCGEKRVHEFSMKDIRHLLGRNEYARFGDLVRFGGIVYKPKIEGSSEKAHYGMNMARAKEFFSGNYEIPIEITLNQITNEIIGSKYVKVTDFPTLSQMITEKGLYDYNKLF